MNSITSKIFKLKFLLLLNFLPILCFTSCKEVSEDYTEKGNIELDYFADTQIIDLSHDYSRETIYWVTAKEFQLDTVAYGDTEKGYFYAANNFSTAEHGGTHIDAPIHFAKGTQSVDEIPLEKLMGKAIKIDIKKEVEKNRDYQITIEDFKNWEKESGIEIPEECIVLLETGISKYYPDKLKYLGTDKRGEEAVKDLHFLGLSPDAAKWLMENRNINAIGIDTPSIDYGQSQDFKTHVALLSKNVPAFENLTNLDKLPLNDFSVIALPMKIKGGSGGPLRIVAILKNQ
ncbi:cyclase family protein [Gelidibacter salicanalis]|uniref:Cyclase family protein n=1 Tax=Gelidibacter salicanalis TaxID=291193 RepID=A0A934NHZ4_9FLAO|nr:cyclase family protein [Gelidibacter salicanalis]MBJ7880423.1 cyclase family protein [Gelidibacter salicanalis]